MLSKSKIKKKMLLQKLYVNNIIIYINIISRWCPRHNQTSSSNGNVTFKKAKSSKKKKKTL